MLKYLAVSVRVGVKCNVAILAALVTAVGEKVGWNRIKSSRELKDAGENVAAKVKKFWLFVLVIATLLLEIRSDGVVAAPPPAIVMSVAAGPVRTLEAIFQPESFSVTPSVLVKLVISPAVDAPGPIAVPVPGALPTGH